MYSLGPEGEDRTGSYPVVQLICGNCGNTLLFNADVMGLLKDRDDDALKSAAEERDRD
jgi:hypothetical protein